MNEINIELNEVPAAGSQGNKPNNNVDALKSQVNDVTNTMRLNMERVLERDNNLNTLVDQSVSLENASVQFENQARKVKRKMWWKNIKMTIILFLIFIVLLTAIGVALGSYVQTNSSSSATTTTTSAAHPTAATTTTTTTTTTPTTSHTTSTTSTTTTTTTSTSTTTISTSLSPTTDTPSKTK